MQRTMIIMVALLAITVAGCGGKKPLIFPDWLDVGEADAMIENRVSELEGEIDNIIESHIRHHRRAPHGCEVSCK